MTPVRPSSRFVPARPDDSVSARPVPIGDENHTDDHSNPSSLVPHLDEELATRLAAALSLHTRRQRLRAQARGEATAGRDRGKALEHAQKIRHVRAGDTEPKETP